MNRSIPRGLKTTLTGIALSWALFQLALPQFLILDHISIRAVHLMFAIILAFLLFPFRRTKGGDSGSQDQKDTSWKINGILAIFGAAAVLYIVIDWHGIALRSGSPLARDLIIGAVAVILLLEASRRIIGPALVCVVTFFTLYAFLGPYLPDVMAFKGVSIRKFLTQVFLSSEGIYGIPLGVSATIVYLFVLFGALLERAGAGSFFIRLSLSVLGRFRGGPAKAAVFSSGLMGTISGSSVANIVTTGTFTIPLMIKVGYPPKKAAAIEVAASTDGQLMPPIMGAAAFIIAEYVNVPYIEVVKAAAIPAFVSYGTLFYITHLEACKLGIQGMAKEEIPPFWQTLKEGFHFLVPLFVLIIELMYFRHSPELSAFRAILSLMGVILYQEIRKAWRDSSSIFPTVKKAANNSLRLFVSGCVKGSKNMITVAIATAVAGIIVGIVNLGMGGMINQIVEILSGGNIVILLIITALACLILGMGLPTTATYIVMASLTAPIIVEVGSKFGLGIPLISAHLFCFYFGILADDTPPVGLASYAAAAIAGSRPIPTGVQGFLYDLRTAVIPFMFVANTDIILLNIKNLFTIFCIFSMTLLGALAFTSSIQGWFVSRTKLLDRILLLFAALTLFLPRLVASFLPVQLGNFRLTYILGMMIFIGVFLLQKRRESNKNHSAREMDEAE
jgi:TRAP transporter 4TM/12TM fusion protein